MDVDDLVARYPRLFHMANSGSWEQSIRSHGLQTTSQIVATAGLSRDAAAEILELRRPESVALEHPILGGIAIRDQGPLNLTHLTPKLTDVSVKDWLAILNNRVFFWLHPDKLQELLNARRYRSKEQDVLTIDTRSLVDAHLDRVRLSPINSGSSLWPNAAPRGSRTFLPVNDYDFDARRKGRNDKTAIVELAVIDGVPDIAAHTIKVERRIGSTVIEELPLH